MDGVSSLQITEEHFMEHLDGCRRLHGQQWMCTCLEVRVTRLEQTVADLIDIISTYTDILEVKENQENVSSQSV